MSLKKLRTRILSYRILTGLLLSQVVITIGASAGCLIFVCSYAGKKGEIDLERQRTAIFKVISPYQDTLRAWKQMQAEEPLSEKIRMLNAELNPATVDVKILSTLEAERLKSDPRAVIFPQISLPYSSAYVVVRVPKDSFWGELKDLRGLGLYALVFLLGSFFFTLLYVYRYIYAPIRAVVGAEDPGRIDLYKIGAKGEIHALLAQVLDYRNIKIDYDVAARYNALAAQVAHDIRSPLAALDSVLNKADQLSESHRVMVRHAVNRIRDIANNLLEKARSSGARPVSSGAHAEPPERQLLSSLIDPVVSEKRMQFESRSGIRITFELTRESYGLFAAVQPVEFRRVLSNLVNNAVEALGDIGEVRISLKRSGAKVVIKVSDNGKGIPSELLSRLGQKGETYGKSGGSGLGLYHARTTVEGWGGRLDIESELGKGAAVSLILPAVPVPDDFVPVLKVVSGGIIVVLDDDPTTHQLWDGRFGSARLKDHGIEVRHFNEPDSLRHWVRENEGKAGKAVYLFDYELIGHKETGLGLAEELGVCDRAILVTSRNEEKQVLEEARRLKMSMIPKGLADFVPLVVVSAEDGKKPGSRSAVLIDDDALVRMNWESAAAASGVNLKVYIEPSIFMSELDKFPRNTAIYIDSELGNNVKGEDIALSLYEKGFNDITLETGHEPAKFAHLPWLKVTGKESPWRA